MTTSGPSEPNAVPSQAAFDPDALRETLAEKHQRLTALTFDAPATAAPPNRNDLWQIPGTLGYIWVGWGAENLPPFSLGYVSLIGAAIIIPASVFAAPFGVRVAHSIPRRRLELAFAVFLACVAVRFFVDLLG